jgi:hypothetical protein
MEMYYDRNVYIVGAGFSADAGIPLVKDFMRKLRDGLRWLKVNGRDSEVSAVKRVLKFRSEAASAVELVSLDLEDIEELFSLESAAVRGTLLATFPWQLRRPLIMHFTTRKTLQRTLQTYFVAAMSQKAGRIGRTLVL